MDICNFNELYSPLELHMTEVVSNSSLSLSMHLLATDKTGPTVGQPGFSAWHRESQPHCIGLG